jgi:hypothetical protein
MVAPTTRVGNARLTHTTLRHADGRVTITAKLTDGPDRGMTVALHLDRPGAAFLAEVLADLSTCQLTPEYLDVREVVTQIQPGASRISPTRSGWPARSGSDVTDAQD